MRVSSIGGSCIKKIQLEDQKVEAKFSDLILRAFEDGNMHEPSIIKQFEQDYEKTVSYTGEWQMEVWVVPDVLKGHPDGVIVEENALVECKALRKKGIFELRKKGVKESHPQYYTQIQLYMFACKLSKCYFVARDKDTPTMKQYEQYVEVVEYDSDFVKEFLVKFNKIQEQIKQEIEPPLNPTDNWECRYCGYAYVCHPNHTHQKRAPNEIDDPELEKNVFRYQELSELIRDLEAEKDMIKEILMASLPIGTTAIDNYSIIVSQVDTKKLDAKKLEEEFGKDILDQMYKVTSYKKLMVKENG